MKRYVDVIHRILELSETTQEALKYVHAQVMNGNGENALEMFVQVIAAFSQIETSLAPIIKQLSANDLLQPTGQLRESINHVVTAYEQGADPAIFQNAFVGLVSVYVAWREELVRTIEPYVLAS